MRERNDNMDRLYERCMARNQASHLIAIARNKDKSYAEVLSEIIVMISPLFQMMYDRLVAETIEKMEGE